MSMSPAYPFSFRFLNSLLGNLFLLCQKKKKKKNVDSSVQPKKPITGAMSTTQGKKKKKKPKGNAGLADYVEAGSPFRSPLTKLG